jgi:hypothetical protein
MVGEGASSHGPSEISNLPVPSSGIDAVGGRSEMSMPPAKTEFSATVFSGEARDWVRYLSTAAEARYEPGTGVRILLQSNLRLIAFDPENEDSRWLAELLGELVRCVRERAARKPNVAALLDDILFGQSNGEDAGARIVLSPLLPCSGTREASAEAASSVADTHFVLQGQLLRRVRQALEEGTSLSDDERLGFSWPVASRLLSQIAYPLSPRDRFVAKIDAFAKLTYLAINLLYDEYQSGRLVPNAVGASFETLMSQQSGLPRARLFERHPYFRMLAKLSFLLRALPYASYADEARIVAREYLDTVYLRLSLASAMPDLSPTERPMPLRQRWGRLRAAKPLVGQYGIADKEDEAAWKKLAHLFRDIGFILVRQIGVGEFGRVYEAINERNAHLPARVALKVDRIMGRRKQAILEAAAAAQVGGQLARAPHLVRLYDTGKIGGRRFTYHVLQLIDGDTIDALIQVAGAEHASTGWPPSVRTSERQARAEYERAVFLAGREERAQRRRMGLPFRYPLSAAMVLDVLTSMLLTVDEVHRLGYSINDLKNDNLMMSRRGQIKVIDLDSFAPIVTPFDKATDFMFLAASIILFVFNAPSTRPRPHLAWKELAESEERLRREFAIDWPLGNVELASERRVSKQELIDLLVDLVTRCHRLVYTRQPDLFEGDIARLIGVKRRLRAEEFVID